MYVCMCVCVHAHQRALHISFNSCLILRQGLSFPLDRLPIEPLGSDCIHPSSAGVKWALAIRTQVLMPGEHFAH